VLLTVLGLELCVLPLRRPRVVVAADVDGAVLVTTGQEWGNRPVRRILPPAPPPGSNWERPPCKEKWMHVINNACWAKVEGAEPPCSAGLYEHKGGCFSPVVKGQRPPTSLKGEP
jgi:hypothetical protein